MEHALLQLGSVIALGILAEWLGWRLRLPAILFLLVFGALLGPLLHFVDPDALFGSLLMPLVSVSVALILFEGGLSLRRSELDVMGRVTWLLVTVGALITWVLLAAAASVLLDMELPQAILLGSILVVTGPTVIGPLLRHIRPRGPVGSVLKWEGILIDPIGAALAVLVFEAVVAGRIEAAPGMVALGVIKTLAIGAVVGGAAAILLILFLERYWIPEHLQTPATLALVVAAFVVSNRLQHEAGLLTVTLMGILLANQQRVEVRHVIAFKENLRVVLLSTLFIILAARLEPAYLAHIGGGAWLFLAVLILVARPVSVAICAWGSRLTWAERGFLAWMAPRGIVAAAIASVFALRLEEAHFANAEQMVAVVFLVVASTVLLYGLTAGPLARLLGVSQPNPQGVLFVGAHPLARQMAAALDRENVRTLLVDSNWSNVAAARMDGLKAQLGNANSEYVLEDVDVAELGRMIAVTANNKVNAFAALVFADVFGRRGVYQLSAGSPGTKSREESLPHHLRGRTLFDENCTFDVLMRRVNAGAIIKTTKLTREFPYEAFRAQYGDTAVPLFAVLQNGRVHVFTPEEPFTPPPGTRLISLAPPLPY